MKNILLLKNARLLHVLSFAFLFLFFSGKGYGQISEGFESGLPSSYDATLTTRTLSSGSWQVLQVIAGTTGVNGGTKSAQLQSATGSQLITPTLVGGVGTISFYVTASTTSGAYQVNISTDNGSTWSPATGSPFTIGTTKTLRTITVNNSSVNKIQIYRTGATLYIDDFSTTLAPGGATPPTLTAAAGATVDAPFDVTFTDDSAWRSAITSITYDGTTVASGAYDKTQAGKITFTPSASAALQTAKTAKNIVIVATGYTNATIAQTIGAGAATKLAMNTQPAAPATNGGALATQPKVTIVDQYGNTTTSTATVTAAVGAGTWTLGGTTSVAAVSGTTTYSGLTATSAAAVTGATIAFSCNGLTGVTSSAFNIAAPAPANDTCAGAVTIPCGGSVTVDNTSATNDALPGITCGSATSTIGNVKGIWFKVTPTAAGTVTISTCPTATAIDTYLRVYSGGTPCTSFAACAGSGDDNTACTANTLSSLVTFTAVANTTYYVLCGLYDSSKTPGAITISATCPVPLVNPTITYNNQTVTYGDTGVTMTATSDSSGAMSYTSTNTAVATINSSTGAVTIKGAGTTTMIVNQAATAGYNAGSASATLTVNKANGITITANNVSKSYGTTLSNGTSIAFSFNGLKYTDGLGTGATVNVAYGSGAASTDAVGSYTGSVVPSSLTLGTGATYNSANYNATTYVNGDITVTVANQNITFAATDSKVYGTADYAPGATSATSGINPITYSSSNTAVADIISGTIRIVGVGSTTITASQAGDSNYNAATATQTLTVTAKGLTISGLTANNKIFDGTTDATLSGTASLVGVVGSDDVTLTGTPVASFVSASVGNGKQVNVTGYSLNGTKAGNYTLTQPTLFADIIATTPTLFTSGTLNGLSTVYGTASGTTSFAVSGQSLNEGILVTAPAGFEVSNGGDFASTVTVGGSGNVSSTTITVRLAATTVVGAYSGNIVVSSAGAVSLNVATVSSTVTPKGLTITGLTGNDKTYDGTTTATVSGIATLNGVVGSDNVTLNGTSVTYNFANANAGAAKPITALGFTLNGTAAGNYTVAQPTGLTATINKAASSIAVTGTLTFTYNGTAQGPNTSSVTGSTGAITYSYNGVSLTTYGPSATRPTNVGTYKAVASVAADTNYEAATSADFNFEIIKGNQTISLASTDAKTTATTSYTLPLNASSGLPITYTTADTSVITISGNTVTIVGPGTATITANQAGNANYNAAPAVTQTLTVTQGSVALATYTFTGTACSAAARAASNVVSNVTFGAATVTGQACNSNGGTTSYSVGGSSWGTAFSSSRYVEFTVTPNAGYLVNGTSLTFDILRTSAGATNATVRSSVDNYTADLITAFTVGTTSANKSVTLDSASFTNKSTTITFRIYGWGGNSSGDLRLDNITLNGYISRVPAPSITSALTANGTVGTSFTYATTASNNPSSYGATGLPTGLSINTTSGAITGTPTVAGTFTVSLSATNPTGTDTKTLVITVAKGTQSITFNTLASKTYGDAAFTLNGTSTSGLPVSYSSSNTAVATVSGNTVTIVGAGSTTITASQTGDDNYNAATSVDQVLVVNKANQTITFGTLSPKNDTDGSFTLGATASSGLPVSYSSSNPSVLTISGNTVTIVAPGTAVITASQAGNDNYNAAASVDQEQNIINTSLANQTITFGPLSPVTYGDGPFVLTGSVNSSLTITYTSSNPAVASVSGNTVTIHAPGTTTITASQDGDSSHNPAQDVAQSLVVAKKGLDVVNVSVANKTYDGTTAAVLTASLVGVVGTDDVTLSNAAAFATANAGTGIAVTANLSIGGAQADRYVLTQPSNLSADILMANQVISFGSLADKTYGDAPFTVSATGGDSGSPIVFTSSDPLIASVSGNTVTIVGAGTVTITASQAGNSNYNAATDVAQTFTISKANQTITFNALVNRTTTDSTFSLNGSSSSALSVVYSSSNPAVATITGNVVTIVGAGSTIITASQPGNSNYNAAADVAQTQLVLTAIAKWTFEGVTTTNTGTTPTVSVGSAIADQGDQTSGSLFSANHANSSTWSNPSGNGSGKSVSSNNWSVNDYWQFKVNTSGYHSIAIAFDQTGSSTGPSTFKAQYSLNGVSYTDLPGGTYTLDGGSWTTSTFRSQAVRSFDLSAINGLNNKSAIYFRLVDVNTTSIGNGTVASTGSSRIDNFVVTGIACEAATATITAEGATSFCEGGSVTLTASEGPSYLWSTGATTQSITVSASGNYSVQEISANGCAATSNTIAVTVTPNTTHTTTISACDSYLWSVNGQTYNASGNYTYVNGCHTETLALTITPSTTHTTTVSACDSYTWTAGNGQTYTASGNYSYVNGCHTETLALTITPSTTHTTTVSACDSYTWSVNGQTYNVSGNYTYVNGCHTETLALTITPSTSNTTTATACDTYIWSVTNQEYTASGNYTYSNGCHTEYLNLTINSGTSHTTPIAACGSYTWTVNNVTYTESGKYTVVTGCNEEILELTITPETSNTTTASACGTYHWAVNDVDYTQSGTYTSVRDCHTETLVLTIIAPSTHTNIVSACGSYTWANNNQTYTASGTYTGTTTNCVTEVLALTITPSSTHTTTVSTCDSYTWLENGQTYTASGTYSSVNGCHTELLNLTINSYSITTQPATTNICGAVGSTASMSVATNVPVSSYSWQYRVPTTANPNPAWITITAANAAVYSNYDTATLGITKTSTLPAKGTQYRVLINEGDCGILASDLAS
ncbi:DUF1533 domain-containing protein, partial [Flavobacterium silvisoli]